MMTLVHSLLLVHHPYEVKQKVPVKMTSHAFSHTGVKAKSNYFSNSHAHLNNQQPHENIR